MAGMGNLYAMNDSIIVISREIHRLDRAYDKS